MTKLIARFYKDESGATAIEYGLIAALIAVAIMVGAGALGTNINDKFQDIADKIANPNAPAGGGTTTTP
ncbi:MAG: Flp family type IVb pilin [Mesorhizobium sp.]